MRQVSPVWLALTYCLTFILMIFAAVTFPAKSAVAWLPAARLSLNATALALADSDLAVVSGARAVVSNPAGIATGVGNEAQATHLSPLPSTTLDGLALTFSTRRGGWGLGVQQLVASDLLRTSAAGEVLGHFGYEEGALTVAGATPVGRSTFGIALRGLWQALDDNRVGGGEIVLGAQWPVRPRWHAGLVVSGYLGPSGVQGNEVNLSSVPLGFATGMSYLAPRLSAHCSLASDEGAVGVELYPVRGLTLRLAGRHRNGETALRVGGGVVGGSAALDYAYVAGGAALTPQQLALGHVVSLRFTF